VRRAGPHEAGPRRRARQVRGRARRDPGLRQRQHRDLRRARSPMSALQLGVRPDRTVLVSAGWRATLVVAAAVAVALEAPAWARFPLSAAAVLAVATFLLRR